MKSEAGCQGLETPDLDDRFWDMGLSDLMELIQGEKLPLKECKAARRVLYDRTYLGDPEYITLKHIGDFSQAELEFILNDREIDPPTYVRQAIKKELQYRTGAKKRPQPTPSSGSDSHVLSEMDRQMLRMFDPEGKISEEEYKKRMEEHERDLRKSDRESKASTWLFFGACCLICLLLGAAGKYFPQMLVGFLLCVAMWAAYTFLWK